MISNIELSEKQAEYIRNATHRWNGKVGATQCGKTYIDTLFVIQERIIERLGKPGLVFITGVSKETIRRNVIEPMQELFGEKVVSDINSQNIAMIFGEKVHCIGADNIGRVRRFRGPRVKYLYIDEAYDINKEVFELLKSRLSFEYSVCDFAGNPQGKSHWLEKFINRKDIDIYLQRYSIFDNPFLPKEYVRQLCVEYEGTIYYDRYILGNACNAEGIIYRLFADKTEEYLVGEVPDDENLFLVTIGIDYGAGQSKTKFVATGITYGFSKVYILDEVDLQEVYDPDRLYAFFIEFYRRIFEKYRMCQYAFCDYGALGNVLTLGLIKECNKNNLNVRVEDCSKGTIKDRIFLSGTLFAQKRLKILRKNINIINAFSEALWNSKKEDERLDDGTTDIDSLDAFEYSINSFYEQLVRSKIK